MNAQSVHLRQGIQHKGAVKDYFTTKIEDVKEIKSYEDTVEIRMKTGNTLSIPISNVAALEFGGDE